MSLPVVKLKIEHLDSVKSLLRDCGLPYEDCGSHISNFIGIVDKESLIAIGGIEVLNKIGLLRSVAVQEDYRGRGLATVIVDYLHEQARTEALQSLFLLTETAESYFAKLGYRAVSRDELPVEIKATRQFQSLCPASAQAMEIQLQQANL